MDAHLSPSSSSLSINWMKSSLIPNKTREGEGLFLVSTIKDWKDLTREGKKCSLMIKFITWSAKCLPSGYFSLIHPSFPLIHSIALLLPFFYSPFIIILPSLPQTCHGFNTLNTPIFSSSPPSKSDCEFYPSSLSLLLISIYLLSLPLFSPRDEDQENDSLISPKIEDCDREERWKDDDHEKEFDQ